MEVLNSRAPGFVKRARALFLFVFFLVVLGRGSSCSAQAVGKTTWGKIKTGSPFAAGLWFDVAPLLTLTDRAAEADDYEPDIDDVVRYFDRPALLSGGFSLAAGPFRAAMVLELQQDFGEMLKGGALTNLLVGRDGTGFMFSNDYPNVGYLEGSGSWWRLSLGRRAINIGRGLGSLTVSGFNPRYDHATVGLSAPLGAGSLGYDFLVIGVPRTSGDADDGKSLFFHRLDLDFPAFSLGFSEYNLVTGVPLDLQDIGPFLVYHHLFADGSNVMFHLDGEWRPASSLRLYAETLMDDFQLGSEGSSSNPDAFGFSAGLQWRLLDGAPMERPRYFRKDYRLDLVSKPLDGGLIATLEAYWASTYLYRRKESASNQAYFTRYFMQSDSDRYEVPAWFAYPLGPDRILLRGDLTYSLPWLIIKLGGDFAILGAEYDTWTYTEGSYDDSWLGPQGPISFGWNAKLGVELTLGSSTLITAAFRASRLGTENLILVLDIGAVHRFGIGFTP